MKRIMQIALLSATLSAGPIAVAAGAQQDAATRLLYEWDLSVQNFAGAPELIPKTSSPTPLAVSSSGPELFVTLHAGAFHPMYYNWNVPSVTGDFLARYCLQDVCSYFANAPLPHGASLIGIELDACNEGSEGPIKITLIRMGGGESGKTNLASGVLPAGLGCGEFVFRVPSEHVVNQFSNSYAVLVQIGEVVPCFNDPAKCPTMNQRFLAVRLYYEVAGDGTVEPTKPAPYRVFPP